MADHDVDDRASREASKRTLLRDVERALLDALSESPEMHRVLDRLQRAGWTLRVSLDCRSEPEPAPEPDARPSGRERGRGDQPRFRIDAEDLRFLRSIGIDPTRRRPRRRARG